MYYRVVKALGTFKKYRVGEVVEVPRRHDIGEREGWVVPVAHVIPTDPQPGEPQRVTIRVMDVIQNLE
jgi:hypothetical protein